MKENCSLWSAVNFLKHSCKKKELTTNRGRECALALRTGRDLIEHLDEFIGVLDFPVMAPEFAAGAGGLYEAFHQAITPEEKSGALGSKRRRL
jgi:hypothetical protein